MAEVGARPKVSPVRRKALRALESLFTPLLPDDYLELINPLWSTRELRGRVVEKHRETEDAATITIKPGHEWPGHRAGQYLRIGVVVDGVHHWRAYSITSDPGRHDRCISITPKLVEEGVVSPFLVRELEPGAIVRLGGVEGTFTLPDPLPDKLLFVSAGSGITPVMAMLRDLDTRGEVRDVVHLHSARTDDDVIFRDRLEHLDARHPGYRLDLRRTRDQGRMTPDHLDELCPDWRDREAFVCGPGELLDAMKERWDEAGDPGRMHFESFQPVIGGDPGDGKGGTVKFLSSRVEAECDAGKPILVAGEEAGASLPFGCRMGICHTCTGKLCSGKVRDLRTGEVSGSAGEMVRTCIHAPEGDVVIQL